MRMTNPVGRGREISRPGNLSLAADGELLAGARYEQVGGSMQQRLATPGQRRCLGHRLASAAPRPPSSTSTSMISTRRSTLIRGTDDKGCAAAGALPLHGDPSRRTRCPGGSPTAAASWSLTMYDRDYFMLANSPNGRTNIGTVNLDADELKFAADGFVDPAPVPRPARGQGCAGQLAARARWPVCAAGAQLCAHEATARQQLPAAERGALTLMTAGDVAARKFLPPPLDALTHWIRRRGHAV